MLFAKFARRLSLAIVLIATCATWLALPATSSASQGAALAVGTAHLSNQHLKLELPDAPAFNYVNITLTGSAYTITATYLPSANIDPAYCLPGGNPATELVCDMGIDAATGLEVHGGTGGDAITVNSTAPVEFHGHEGTNQLTGGSSTDYFVDTDGDGDTLNTWAGRSGVDEYFHVAAGTVANQVSYAGHDDAVTATLDCMLNDGGAEEGGATENAGCNAQSIRVLIGGDGNDTLSGHPTLASDEFVYGGAGADTIAGGDGGDYLYGDGGADAITGGAGSDSIFGGFDNDNVDGGAGDDDVSGDQHDDIITGGSGVDTIEGDEVGAGDGAPDFGNDTIYARDGVDDVFIYCDGGTADLVYADPAPKDSGPACETVHRATVDDGLVDVLAGNAFVGGAHLVVDTPTGPTATQDITISSTVANVWTITFNTGNAAALLISDECTRPSASVISCTVSAGEFAAGVEVWGGWGASTVTMAASSPLYLHGEYGTNLGIGGPGDDTFNGSTYSNVSSINTFEGNAGHDTYIGGDGLDYARFTNHAAPVQLSTDCVRNDGDAGIDGALLENVGCPAASSKMDGVTGSGFADTITGDAAANTLYGAGGNDDIRGRGANDTIKGQAGDDYLNGEGGADTIHGGSGNDEIVGGSEADSVYGDTPFTADTGTDTVNMLDGIADTALDCGPGGDSASLDRVGLDTQINCESVTQEPAPTPPAPPAPAATIGGVDFSTVTGTRDTFVMPDFRFKHVLFAGYALDAAGSNVTMEGSSEMYGSARKLPKSPDKWEEGDVVSQTPAPGTVVTYDAAHPARVVFKWWMGPTKESCLEDAAEFKSLEFDEFQAVMSDIGCRIEDVHVQWVGSTTKKGEVDANSGERCEVSSVNKAGAKGRWLDATVSVPRDPALQDLRMSFTNNDSTWPGFIAPDWYLSTNAFTSFIVKVQSRSGQGVNGVTLYFDMSGVSSKGGDDSFSLVTKQDATFGPGVVRVPKTWIAKVGTIEVLATMRDSRGASVCATASVGAADYGNGKNGIWKTGDYGWGIDGKLYQRKAGKPVEWIRNASTARGYELRANRPPANFFEALGNLIGNLMTGRGLSFDGMDEQDAAKKSNRAAATGVRPFQLAMGDMINGNAAAGKIVAAGGLNLIGMDGATLVGNDGASFASNGNGFVLAAGTDKTDNVIVASTGKGGIVAAGGLNMVAAGGGNIRNDGINAGESVIVNTPGGAIVAAGGLNMVAAGAGNIVAAGGLN